jgi:hypothetical protein
MKLLSNSVFCEIRIAIAERKRELVGLESGLLNSIACDFGRGYDQHFLGIRSNVVICLFLFVLLLLLVVVIVVVGYWLLVVGCGRDTLMVELFTCNKSEESSKLCEIEMKIRVHIDEGSESLCRATEHVISYSK